METLTKIQNSKIIKLFLLALAGSILITISAKIKIPFYPVPMTMQTFMVLLIGIAFGPKLGVATVGLYLFEGIIGLPVFSNSPEKGIGILYFTGPTMGYLIGFLVAVFITGYFQMENNYLMIFLKLIFAVSFIYALGLLWLGVLIGWDKPIFQLGFQPFLLAEIFKLALLTILYPQIKKINKFI